MPAAINNAAATGTNHAVRHRRKKLGCEGRAGCLISPSFRSCASIEFQILTLGSSNSRSDDASAEIRLKSANKSEHAEHEFKCARCSEVLSPSRYSDRAFSNCRQFIQPLPE